MWFVGGCIWLMAPKESVNGLACAKAKRWDAPSCLAISGGWVSGSSYLYVGFLFHASFFSLTSSLISLKLSYTIVASLCCNFPSGSNIPTVRSLCHFYQFSCCLQLPSSASHGAWCVSIACRVAGAVSAAHALRLLAAFELVRRFEQCCFTCHTERWLVRMMTTLRDNGQRPAGERF